MTDTSSSTTADQPFGVLAQAASQEGDQPSAGAGGVEAGEPKPSSSDPASDQAEGSQADPSTDDLSEDQLTALASHDPKAIYRAATKKFQQASKLSKALEPHQTLISALQQSPVDTLTELAKQYGLEVRNPQAPAPPDPKQAAEERITATIEGAVGQIKDALGPEYEDLADRLGPSLTTAIREVAQEVAGGLVKQTTEPLLKQREADQRAEAERSAKDALEVFGKTHPDLEKVLPKMQDLAGRMTPSKDVSSEQYLEMLYTLANTDAVVDRRVEDTVKRMRKSAETASRDKPGIPPTQATHTPKGLPSLEEAWAAAGRGERFAH